MLYRPKKKIIRIDPKDPAYLNFFSLPKETQNKYFSVTPEDHPNPFISTYELYAKKGSSQQKPEKAVTEHSLIDDIKSSKNYQFGQSNLAIDYQTGITSIEKYNQRNQFARPEKRYQWRLKEVKSSLKNKNLERLKEIDHVQIAHTKKVIKSILEKNKNNLQFLDKISHYHHMNKQDVDTILKTLGHNFNNEQLDIFMIYVNPYHQGKISRRNLDKASQNLEFFEKDVKEDLKRFEKMSADS